MTIKEINKITERYSCEFRQHLKSMYNIGYSEGARSYAAMIELTREEKETKNILAEIKAEIEQKCCITVGSENEPAMTLYDVFHIIDKYKAESEDKE